MKLKSYLLFIANFFIPFVLAKGILEKELAYVKVSLVPESGPNGDRHHFEAEIGLKNGDRKLNLKLTPIRNSIFARGFKFQLASKDSAGNLVLRDVTPGNDHLSDMQKGIYVDKAKRSVLRLKRDVKGYQMNGVIEDHAISNENGYHYAVPQKQFIEGSSNSESRSDQGYSYPVPEKKFDIGASFTLPIIGGQGQGGQLPEEQPPHFGPGPSKRLRINAEIVLIISNDNYNQFGKNITDIISYFAIFMHAVNDRYASIKSKDLKMRTTIVGIIANEDPSAEPYLADCYRDGGGKECIVTDSLVPHFGRWILKNNDKLPGRDILVLIHNAQNAMDQWGGAFTRGSCIKKTTDPNIGDIDASSAAVKDYGGAFAGVHTMAHELAHNFGASHDGEIMYGFDGVTVDATSCPKEKGYIMSYTYGVREKFYFSTCSIQNMTNYLQTNNANCLKRDQYKAWWASDADGGEFLTMHDQCMRLYPDAMGVWNNYNLLTPEDQCIRLWCQRRPSVPYSFQPATRGYYPADLSPCGVNGICQRGKCVKQPSLYDQCRVALNNPKAYYDNSKTPESLCANVDCVYADEAGLLQRVSLNKPALEHTPCGLNGRCINETCRVQARIPSFDQQCQATALSDAARGYPYNPTAAPPDICTNLFCQYPDTGNLRFTLGIPPLDFTPCQAVGNDTAFCYRAQCGTLDFHLQNTPTN